MAVNETRSKTTLKPNCFTRNVNINKLESDTRVGYRSHTERDTQNKT
jgi:hypothetical protein